MALVHCTKCGHYPVSTKAPKCRRCGAAPYQPSKVAPTAIAPAAPSQATERAGSLAKRVPAYAQVCGILALALAVAGLFIPLVGVLFLTPIAIVFGSVALYGRYKVVGVATLVVVIVNFLISPTFWLNLLASASESQASVNRWLALFDVAGVIGMLYLSVRKPQRLATTTNGGQRRGLGAVALWTSVTTALAVAAAVTYRLLPSGGFAPVPSSPGSVSPPSWRA
jgi:hypothetical protein